MFCDGVLESVLLDKWCGSGERVGCTFCSGVCCWLIRGNISVYNRKRECFWYAHFFGGNVTGRKRAEVVTGFWNI